MRQILIYTVLVELFICVLMGSAMLFKGESPGWILYKIFVIMGKFFFPILIASAFHYFVATKRFLYNLKGWSFSLQILLMFAVIQVGLGICATFDAIISLRVSTLSLDVIVSDYKKEFLSAVPITILIAFAFPLLDKMNTEREEEFQG